MGDPSIAQDLLDGVEEIMDEVGRPLFLRDEVGGRLLLDNPGAGPLPTETINHPITGFIYDYEDKYINGTTVKIGDRKAIVSIKDLSVKITPGMRVVDGDDTYNIVKVGLPEASGIPVVAILQIRG